MLGYTKVAIYLLFVTNGTILWRMVYLLRIKSPSCIAAKRAKHAIIHATAMKYDCPMVIMPIKSRMPVNLLAFVCRNWLCLCLSRLGHPNKFGGSRCSRHCLFKAGIIAPRDKGWNDGREKLKPTDVLLSVSEKIRYTNPASCQGTKTVEHNDYNNGYASQWEPPDVARGWESIEPCQSEGQDEDDGYSIEHPYVTKHHIIHYVFDAVCIECFIQCKETAKDGQQLW